jgi:elongation factor Tu
MLELVEMEVRELLSFYTISTATTPIIVRGSALKALEGDAEGSGKQIMELMDAVDADIPDLHVKLTSHS